MFVITTRKWFDVMVYDQQWLPTHMTHNDGNRQSLWNIQLLLQVYAVYFLSRFYDFRHLSLALESHKFKWYIVSPKLKYLSWHQCLMFKPTSLYIYISMHKPNTYCWNKLNLSRKRKKNCHLFVVMEHKHSSMDMLYDIMLNWFQTCLCLNKMDCEKPSSYWIYTLVLLNTENFV
jgi:hypothetical protein